VKVGETWVPGCKCNAGEPVPARVFDPFSGASTTAIVAESLGRQGIGTEINPEYIAISHARREKLLSDLQRRRATKARPPRKPRSTDEAGLFAPAKGVA